MNFTKINKPFYLLAVVAISIVGLVLGLTYNVGPFISPKASLSALASEAGRDPYQWPFSKDSIWNMPIHNSAQYQPAGLGPALDWKNGAFTIDPEIIGTNPNDPVKPLNGQSSDGVRVPADASWDGALNGCTTFLGADNKTLYSGQPLVLSKGGDPSWEYDVRNANGGVLEDIKGAGTTGCHGASHLSGLGGSIRKGEIPSDQDIRHALKINLYCFKYCSPTTAGYRWPAISADGYALTPGASYGGREVSYHGQNPEVKMGSLLALNPSFDINSLTSPSAKKVAKALMNYGGYVVDDTAWDVHALAIDVRAESELFDSPSFDPDMQTVFQALNVITNNTENNIGGGPNADANRRAAFAPCFIGEPNCSNASTTPAPTSTPTPPIADTCSNQEILKVLPLGDSITQESDADNSYRAKEWANITSANLGSKVKFVGIHSDDSPQAPGMAVEHAGYGGYATSNFIDTPPAWGWEENLNSKPMDSLMATNPDIVQIMLGTNDGYRDLTFVQSKAYWTQIINKIRQYNPKAKIIIGMPPAAQDGYSDQVIKPIITDLNTVESPITPVEFVGYDRTLGADTVDGTHNNATGATKMGNAFGAAIIPVINSLTKCATTTGGTTSTGPTTTGGPTTTPTPTTTTTPVGGTTTTTGSGTTPSTTTTPTTNTSSGSGTTTTPTQNPGTTAVNTTPIPSTGTTTPTTTTTTTPTPTPVGGTTTATGSGTTTNSPQTPQNSEATGQTSTTPNTTPLNTNTSTQNPATPTTTQNSTSAIKTITFADVQIVNKTDCTTFDSLNELDPSYKNSGDNNSYVEFKVSCAKITIKTYWPNLNPSLKYALNKYNSATKQRILNFPAVIGVETFNNKSTVYSIHTVLDNGQGDSDTVPGKIWDPYTLDPVSSGTNPTQTNQPTTTTNPTPTPNPTTTINSNPITQNIVSNSSTNTGSTVTSSTTAPTTNTAAAQSAMVSNNATVTKPNNQLIAPPLLVRTGSGAIFSVEMLIFAACLAVIGFAYFKNQKKINWPVNKK